MTSSPVPDLAVIGGTGFYTFLDDPEEYVVETPYGKPSAPIAVGTVEGGRRVAFLPRHGLHHEFPAHKVNYRANLWALRSLGVRQILAPCAVGGLKAERGPGSFVVPDQIFDRTTDRIQTFYDDGAVHVSFADAATPSTTRSACESGNLAGPQQKHAYDRRHRYECHCLGERGSGCRHVAMLLVEVIRRNHVGVTAVNLHGAVRLLKWQ